MLRKVTKLDVAERLGIDARTLRKWETQPDFPGVEDFEALVAWRDKYALGRKGNHDLAAVKLEIANQQLEKLRRENAVAAQKVMPVEEVAQAAMAATAVWQTKMRGILETELPPKLLGLSIAEIRAEIRNCVDQLCAEVKEEMQSCVPK